MDKQTGFDTSRDSLLEELACFLQTEPFLDFLE